MKTLITALLLAVTPSIAFADTAPSVPTTVATTAPAAPAPTSIRIRPAADESARAPRATLEWGVTFAGLPLASWLAPKVAKAPRIASENGLTLVSVHF